MTLGEKIRKLREGKYTQEELAEKMNVHNITISKWENGIQEPHSKRVAELARILGTSTAYLLGDTDNPAPDEGVNAHVRQQSTQERNTNVATITLDNGKKVEAPATPEGYAFLERMFLLSLGRETAQAVATA